MMNLSSKLPDFGTSIFSTMSQLAADHDALNLSQGFPDFQVSRDLIDRVHHHMVKGRNQYAPSPGLPQLREVISKMNAALYGYQADANKELTIFSGATEALFATFTALVSPGDEIILFDPAYDAYDPAIRLSGGIPVHIELEFPAFSVPWEQLIGKISDKTRAIVINNPHNPTGAIWSREDLKQLEEIAEKYDLFVISDEVYHNIVFDGASHQSVLAFPKLARRSVAIFSFGKTLHATGWKVGYASAPEYITSELRKIHQLLTFSVNTPVQFALAEFMAKPEHYNYLSDYFQAKRDAFLSYLKETSFQPIASRGTYFQLLSFRELSDQNDTAMARELTIKQGIASIPVSVFYDQGTDHNILRFCFAKEDHTLMEAAGLLKKAS